MGRLDELLSDLKIAEVGWIGQGHIKRTRAVIHSRGVQFGSDIGEFIEPFSLFHTPDSSGIGVDGVHCRRWITFGESQSDGSASASDIDESRLGVDIYGIQQLPGAVIELPVGKNPWTRDQLNQFIAVSVCE